MRFMSMLCVVLLMTPVTGFSQMSAPGCPRCSTCSAAGCRVATGTLRLLGDPVGGSTMLRTDVLSIRAGSLVVWTIESSLAQSNAAVY